MGRKSITQTTVVVQIEDEILVWTEGLISGTSKDYIAEAKMLSRYKALIPLTFLGPEIEADLNDPDAPEKATAAMLGVSLGRGRLLQAPPSVLELFPVMEGEDVLEGLLELLGLDSDEEE